MNTNVKIDFEILDLLDQIKRVKNFYGFGDIADLRQFEIVVDENDTEYRLGLMTNDSELLAPCVFDDFLWMPKFELTKSSYVTARKNGKWGIIRTDGTENWILPPEYDYISFPVDSVLLVKDGKYGLYNLNYRELVLPIEQDFIYDENGRMFRRGVSFYRVGDKIGVVDFWGNVIEPIYDDVDMEGDSPIMVCKDEVWGYINDEFELTEDPEEDMFKDY